MADYSINFYEGANYGMKPKYGETDSTSPYVGFQLPAGSIGITADARTSNQIAAVSKILSSGTKTVEVGGVMPEVLDYIPQTHFKEINRLKKLAGAELTFHGPLVEPTGVGRERWDPQQREAAERQMWNAVERSHDLEPDGNIVVTFHASNGLPEAKSIVKDENGRDKIVAVGVVNEQTGQVGMMPKSGTDYWSGKKDQDPYEDIKKFNRESWFERISRLNIEARRASDFVTESISALDKKDNANVLPDNAKEAAFIAYAKSTKNPKEYENYLAELEPEQQKLINGIVTQLSYSRGAAEDAYVGLQNAFNQAYFVAEQKKDKGTMKELDEFREKIAPYAEKYRENPLELEKFTEQVSKGVRLLNTVKEPPQVFKPLEEFAIDKASDTFGNIAFKAYEKFTDSAPIISIENPPAGSGLTRADEMEKLVKASREKFKERAMDELGLSEKQADEQAKKLIGVTWDVGHINMLRKHGFTKEDIVAQTKQVAPYVKHVHLSDNFGLEHTELPMGMGNVPIKQHEEALKKEFGDKFKKIKQIVETGGWYQHFKTPPLAETFEAFGSPLYPMKMAGYWNATRGTGAGYPGGYGRILPDQNFNTYGSGFSTASLPTELGGTMPGGRGRFSGNPTE